MLQFLFLLLLFLSGCRSADKSPAGFQMPAMDVNTVIVVPETIPIAFQYVGVVNSSTSVEVRSRVEGVLQKISFVEGQPVLEGDLLYQIDPKPYEVALDNAKGQLAEKVSAQWNASRAVDRIKPIFERNAISHKDLDEAMSNLRIADARVLAAKATVKQAEIDLNYTRIKAPISGIIGESNFGEGSLITPTGKFLTKISKIDPVNVNFYISESDLLKERRDVQNNLLELPKDKNFDVQLTLADGTVDPDLGKLDYTAPTFLPETGSIMMRAIFDNHEGLLRPGQFVRVKLIGAKRNNAIKIPQRAVLQGSKGMFVYLVKDGKAVMQDVQPGEWYEKDWIINSGLNAGDVVIVDGVDKIGPGFAVNAKEIQPK